MFNVYTLEKILRAITEAGNLDFAFAGSKMRDNLMYDKDWQQKHPGKLRAKTEITDEDLARILGKPKKKKEEKECQETNS